MRLVLASLLVLMFVGNSIAATAAEPPKGHPVRIAPTKVSTVSELRKMKFPYAPVLVKAPTATIVCDVAPVRSMGTPANAALAYKTGRGVVLGPGRWQDPATGSLLMAYYVLLDPDRAPQINSSSDSAYVDVQVEYATDWRRILHAVFENVPEGVHSYMLTLNEAGPVNEAGPSEGNSNPLARPDRVSIVAGTYRFAESQLIASGTSIRVLFNCAPFKIRFPGTSIVNAISISVYSKLSGDERLLTFYSLQLVQVD